MTGRVRCFVAVDVGDDAARELERIVAPLRTLARGVRWTRCAQWHLTCKFLGELPAERVAALRSALARGLDAPGFELALRGLGRFPPHGRPRVLWAGLDGDLATFAGVQRCVEDLVEPLGVPREQRPFRPHLTLGRVADSSDLGRLEAAWRRAAASVDIALGAITALRLYRSTLGPGGSTYDVLDEFALRA